MKRPVIAFTLITSVIFTATVSFAGDAATLIEDIPTVQAYTDEQVDKDDITKIVNAGINSPSAMNRQPWHFSVVTDAAIVKDIAGGGDMSSATRAGITDAPVAIVISCKEGSEYDAGLATQTMSIEAQILGYGTKIFTSPARTLNGDRKEEFRKILGIPDEMYACAILIVGIENKEADVVSEATVRYSADEIVSYITP